MPFSYAIRVTELARHLHNQECYQLRARSYELPATVGAEHLPPVYTHNDEVRYGFRCGIQGGKYSAPTKVNNLVYTQDGIRSCEQPCLHPKMGFVRLYGLVITVGWDSFVCTALLSLWDEIRCGDMIKKEPRSVLLQGSGIENGDYLLSHCYAVPSA